MSTVVPMTRQRFSPSVLSATLTLAVGEHCEMVTFDPASGDYRVFYIGLEASDNGGICLSFELYRHGPGYEPRVFDVLSLTLGRPDRSGLSSVIAFHCDAGITIDDLPLMLITLGQITIDLRLRQRPDDALLFSLLSPLARELWAQPLAEGVVA